MTNENDAQWRKERPLFSGLLKYFPDALKEVAYCSYVGNRQHNPGQALHWDRAKSTDEADALMRHLLEAGTVDTDGVRHAAKVAWRALALLQKEIEAERQEDTDRFFPSKKEPQIKVSDLRLDPEAVKNSMYYYNKGIFSDITWDDEEGDPNYWGV